MNQGCDVGIDQRRIRAAGRLCRRANDGLRGFVRIGSRRVFDGACLAAASTTFTPASAALVSFEAQPASVAMTTASANHLEKVLMSAHSSVGTRMVELREVGATNHRIVFARGAKINLPVMKHSTFASSRGVAVLALSQSALAHVSVVSGPLFANTTQEITFGVGHGCAGQYVVGARRDSARGGVGAHAHQRSR